MYTRLTGRAVKSAEDLPFIKMPDLFVAAAALGVRESLYKEISKKKKDIFVADAFDAKTQIPVLAALAYAKTGELETLEDSKLVLEICQNWASGGISPLHDQMLTGEGLRPLYRLVDFIQGQAK